MFSLFQKETTNSIHVNEIDNKLEEISLIDIREPYEYALGSIRSAQNIPMKQLLTNPDKYLEKTRPYYIMCQSGGRSSNAVAALTRAGYNVINVRGGIMSYNGINR